MNTSAKHFGLEVGP